MNQNFFGGNVDAGKKNGTNTPQDKEWNKKRVAGLKLIPQMKLGKLNLTVKLIPLQGKSI